MYRNSLWKWAQVLLSWDDNTILRCQEMITILTDILMYNTFLHRYLVIELIDTEFMPEYIGKLNFYCSAVDDILCREGDNRTIGLLLCKSKDRIKAEYALRDIQKPIGISDYELGQALPKDFRGSLPTIEEIEKELESDSH